MTRCSHRTVYGAAGPCYACARSALTERLEWWRRDIAYKAPEQVDKDYAASIIHDLLAFISPSFILGHPLLPSECDECYAVRYGDRVEHQPECPKNAGGPRDGSVFT